MMVNESGAPSVNTSVTSSSRCAHSTKRVLRRRLGVFSTLRKVVQSASIPRAELETDRSSTSTGSRRANRHYSSPPTATASRSYAPRSLGSSPQPHPPTASAGRSVLTHVLFPQLAQPDLAGEGGPRTPPDDGKSRHSALASFGMIYALCAHPSRATLARGAGRPVRIRARRAV